ncbi:thiamine pyrophosphate-dependent enzyme [Kaistia dalseonensis]|uniref:2-oxoglutarate dehydrogenase E1 component n=1 Tax=Kaistia dalseonensis TaxID=410840 RepID=A0ABU0H557_9HYPH|nr:thiamine pyrophosphate-dependent enzyme [Kaistia dalseonensis]MCX5494071.1 thiamine pyrophosphate-dependent enzyme [Kaistia dalseonensis]MDQ0436649.1 2-oxoisovalerate dehydrogenase E1 component [Kaistia dalseonensis]
MSVQVSRPSARSGKAGSPQKSGSLPAGLTAEAMIDLYESMVLLRKFESVAQMACRKGETPGFFHLYIGQEATAVGICAHLRKSDWVTSTHRGHGHALAKGMAPDILMAELYGRADGCCGGRGGTMHLYDRSIGLFGTNGIVAAGISHAVGAGISARTRGKDDIGVAFFGDGATNHGGFHESLNFAGVMRAPALLVCENNLYATATPLKSATLNPEIASKAAAYGIPGVAVDGNDVIAVYQAAGEAITRARAGQGPTLFEAKTYRTVGHHEGDHVTGTYRTQAEVDEWAARDPIKTYRQRLINEFAVASAEELDAIDARIDGVVQHALEFARNSPEPDPATVGQHIYAEPINPAEALVQAAPSGTVTQSWLDAVRDGIAEEMRRNPHVLYFGEGTGERGGTFAHTKGLWTEFGPNRMIDTPISEQGFTGAAIGASATGARAIADLMFADFMFEAAGQIVLQGSKLRYMSNGQMNAPFIVRVGAGTVRSAGPHHSGTYHPVWGHIPGLIVCMPATPADAKGLMKTALRAGDPVIMMEPKALFASKGEVPVGDHLVPFGLARIARPGRDITIVAAGQIVHRALEAAEKLADRGIEAEVIDLRTIMPLDVKTVAASVARTHRLLIADEGYGPFGVGAEIAQAINELAFDDLDAPVGRVHTEAMSHPLAPSLERAMIVDADRIIAAVDGVMSGRPPVSRHWHALGGQAAEAPAPSPAPKAEAPKKTEPERAAAAPSPSISGEGEPITMPFGDLTISEGTIVRWLKAPGETVKAGDIVAEIETDKAVVEIEAPIAGMLGPIEQDVGAVVPMGGRIGAVLGAK